MAIDSSKITRQLDLSGQEVNKSLQKLSTGKRINKSSDDAAGAAIVAQLEASVKVTNQGARNALDGISIASIADSALGSLSDITARQQELAAQAANGTLGTEQRAALDAEYQQLSQEANRITQTAQYNGVSVFSGSSLQVGSDGSSTSQISTPTVSTSSVVSSGSIATQAGAQSAIDSLAQQNQNISQVRGQIGASVSRIESAERNARDSAIEAESAASRIRDADFAQETANLTASQIRQQTSTALSAQVSKINSDSVLKLLS